MRTIVAASGGDETLARYHAALEHLVQERPCAVLIHSVEGAIDETYASLLESLT